MKRFRGCLMVAFIFACGFLVGGFLGASVGWVGFFHKIAKGGPGALREVMMERAVQDLKLKPEQKVRVRNIVTETGTELAAASAEVRPQLEEIMGRGEDRVREALDPKQREKFDGFAKQVRTRWKAAVQALEGAPLPKTGHPERSGGGKAGGAESKDL